MPTISFNFGDRILRYKPLTHFAEKIAEKYGLNLAPRRVNQKCCLHRHIFCKRLGRWNQKIIFT